jgi:hypothetical protein
LNLTCINTAGGTGTASWGWSYSTQNNTTIAGGGTTTNALTMNNGGAGAASGTTFNGSAAQTISYNTIGASPLAGSASLTTVGTLSSGSIPYSLLTGTPSLTGYVPYTGATGAVNLGTQTLSSSGNITGGNLLTTGGLFANSWFANTGSALALRSATSVAIADFSTTAATLPGTLASGAITSSGIVQGTKLISIGDAASNLGELDLTNTGVGGKAWRIGDGIGVANGILSIYNTTGANIAFQMTSAGVATFSSSVAATSGTFSGDLATTSTTASGSTTTGALKSAGGLGVVGNAYVGGLQVNGQAALTGWLTLGTGITIPSYTVATLPAASQGVLLYVTDALAPTYNATVVGGGAVKTLVVYNGTAWTCH